MRKIRFVDPGRLYNLLKRELDEAYFDVMTKGDLIDRGQLRKFDLAAFVGTKYEWVAPKSEASKIR